MQYAFRVMLSHFSSFFPDLFNGGFQQSLNIYEGRNHQVGGRIFEATQVELDELWDLQLMEPLLTDVEYYTEKS